MKQKILLTGVTGLVGKNLLPELINKNSEIFALIRPGTPTEKLPKNAANLTQVFIDLEQLNELRTFLEANKFDTIVHIAALRGDRKFSRKTFFDVNVNASEQLMINAIKNNSAFIYLSSVGIWGTAPEELPANSKTKIKAENYYYYTKIRCEQLIQKYILQGLNACILRPSVIYGKGDFGFPYKLINMINKGLLFLPRKTIKIHMTNIKLLIQALTQIIEKRFITGAAYTLADTEPVELLELANFISQELKGKKFSRKKIINPDIFRIVVNILNFLKQAPLKSSVEFISKSWYYDVSETFSELNLNKSNTIPGFKTVIDWYKTIK